MGHFISMSGRDDTFFRYADDIQGLLSAPSSVESYVARWRTRVIQSRLDNNNIIDYRTGTYLLMRTFANLSDSPTVPPAHVSPITHHAHVNSCHSRSTYDHSFAREVVCAPFESATNREQRARPPKSEPHFVFWIPIRHPTPHTRLDSMWVVPWFIRKVPYIYLRSTKFQGHVGSFGFPLFCRCYVF